MKNIAIALYQLFVAKNLPTPYFRTIISISGVIMLHYLFIAEIIVLPSLIDPFKSNGMPLKNWVITGALLGCVYFVLTIFIKQKHLKSQHLPKREEKKYLRILTVELIVLALMLVVCTINKFKA